MQSFAAGAIPETHYRVAADASLGNLVAEFGPSRKQTVGFVVAMVLFGLATAGAIAGATQIDWDDSDDVAGIVAALAICGGLTLLFSLAYWLNRTLRVQLYDAGFAWSRRNKLISMRWTDVTSCTARVTRTYVNGVYTGTQHVYVLRDGRAQKIRLGNSLHDIETLGPRVEDQVFRAQIGPAMQSYQAGGSVAFGPYTVSRIGISNGKGMLRWEEVARAEVARGWVRIHKVGKRWPWLSSACGSMPNLRVFLALVSQRVRIDG